MENSHMIMYIKMNMDTDIDMELHTDNNTHIEHTDMDIHIEYVNSILTSTDNFNDFQLVTNM